jgi:hypothetical protein
MATPSFDSSIRHPAVAGLFYPADPAALTEAVAGLLAAGPARDLPAPKAVVAPHAGYIYSGPVAAAAYRRLGAARGRIRRVVLLGPSHRLPFRGLALPAARIFRTPLGDIPVDAAAIAAIAGLPGIARLDAAHDNEHSLEVHLPFLQATLGSFSLVPLVVGDSDAGTVATVLDALWGGPETLIVVSTDLSHYHDHGTARRRDAATARAIERFAPAALGYEDACGRRPLGGLLAAAAARGLACLRLDLRNSGDTAGPRHRVVGYGAWQFSDPGERHLSADLHRELLALAARAIEDGIAAGRPDENGERLPPELQTQRASFVTLTRGDALRGCIGSLEAKRGLGPDVAANAWAAAFRDPRFRPLGAAEREGLVIGVSVLSPPRPLPAASESDLLAAIEPGRDGLLLHAGERRATFLPQVWCELSDPRAFVAALKHKAGIAPEAWPAGIAFWRYRAESFSAPFGDLR